jgi:hypothetical protein
MENEQLAVTNVPTPSRTIRVTHEGDYNVTVNHGVTQADNGRRFLVFATVEEAVQAYDELKAENVKASYLTYSLFVKSQSELDQDSLKTQVLALVSSANITYLRVDDNLHTGKVVVDLLTDYQTLKAGSTDTLRFFHFDPKRVRPKRDQDAQGGQWTQVQNRQRGQANPRPQGGQQRGQGDQQRAQGGQQRPQGGQQRPQGGQQRPQGGQQRAQGGQQRAQGGQRRQGGRGGNTNVV